MSLPKSVNILGHDYKVIWVEQSKLNGPRVAECEWPTRIIRISKEIKSNKEMTLSVFLHEIRHAYQYESGTTQILESQQMETDADSFASFVLSLKKQKVI